MPLEWSWKQLEAVFAAVHRISREGRPAFNSKLRHLQRSGVLPDTRSGRGRAATYGARHVVRVGFALELLQLGMTPEHATAILQRHENEIFSEIAVTAANFIDQENVESGSRMLILYPRGLSYLQKMSERTNADIIDFRCVGKDYPLPVARFSALSLERFVGSLCAAAASIDLCRPDELALALSLVAGSQA